jgi:hypothetical protein
MRGLSLICAVAALAATAPAFPANAYCRGCVIETPKADTAAATLALTARAEAAPITIQASCHVEKQKHGGQIRRVKICE